MKQLSGPELLEADDFQQARARIAGRIHRTPVMSCRALGERVKARLHLKAELFQKTGSFKIRGVFNRLLTLPDEARRRGLISISAGNHAAALAYGAASLGARAVIVMPENAVRTKIEATRAYGGEVVLTGENLLLTCRRIQQERNLTFVHPFDDPLVMAGHGTLSLELLEDLPETDLLIVPVGGGGLIGGVACAAKRLRPEVRVVGVEPVGADVMSRSLAAGKPVTLDRFQTVADGLAAPFAGVHTLAHVQAFVDRVVRVEDGVIVEALRWLMSRAKLAVEPSGAAAYAALLSGAIEPADGPTVCVISGGNIDRDVLRRML